MTYTELERAIKEAPMTWRPALLIVAAEAACEMKVFLPGKASEVVAKIERENGLGGEALGTAVAPAGAEAQTKEVDGV